MDYLIHLLITLNFYVLLAVSLDLLVGYAGLLSLAHAAFFGIGAYSTALLTLNGVPAGLAMLAGMANAAILSVVIAVPSLRVRGIFLLIITIAVQNVVTVTLLNWTEFTGGSAGIARVPRLAFSGVELTGLPFLLFATACTAFIVIVCWRLIHSPFGRLLQAMRDDETGSIVLGKNVMKVKVAVFAFASAIAAFAGSLYAHYTTYVDPHSFDMGVSILILLMVMLGGAGSLTGPILGALVLTALPEILKFIPLPPGAGAALRQLLYGALLILVVFVRPQGLFGKRRAAPAPAE